MTEDELDRDFEAWVHWKYGLTRQAAGDDAPTPIDPADIRPGDVVERRNPPEPETFTIERIAPDGCLIMAGNGSAHRSTDGYSWFLVSRPDPDAEAVDALILAASTGSDGEPDYGNTTPEKILARLREQGWDVVRRAES